MSSKVVDFPTGKIIPPKQMWELYEDVELQPAAQLHGLSISQERERIRLLHIDPKDWPLTLRSYMTKKTFRTPDDVQRAIIAWLKEPMPPEAA